MGVLFFQNGASIGSTAGWGGFTGSNNYVVRYDFMTPPNGASAVSIALNQIFNGNNAGTAGWGFKISSDPTAYANAYGVSADSNIAYMTYSGGTGWHCTLSASGLNLYPSTIYYLFVYLTGGTEYYTGWNCTNPTISCSGSYTPPDSNLAAISGTVVTGDKVSIVMNNAAGLSHTAKFMYGDKLLATSGSFGSSLSFLCPRTWMQENTSVDRETIKVEITSSAGRVINTSFTLICDNGMKPVLHEGAAAATVINPSGTPETLGFIAGVSRAKVTFDDSKIDLSATEGATIAFKEISWNGNHDRNDPFETDILTGKTRITVTVQDTRGRKAESVINISPIAYVIPSINNAGAARCLADGTDKQSGAYYKVIGSTVFTSLDGWNTVTVYASISPAGGVYGTETALTGWEDGHWSNNWAVPSILGGDLTGDSYNVKLRIEDKLGSTSEITVGLYTQEWALKFNSRGSALGIGMAPTVEDALQIPDGWKLYAGALVLSTNSYGVAPPEEAVQNPVEGQLYFLLTD